MSDPEALRRRGDRYYAGGWLEAAAESWQKALAATFDPVAVARLHDSLGKVWAQRGQAQRAFEHFQLAESMLDPDRERDLWLMVAMHSALAQARMAHADRAYRAAQRLTAPAEQAASHRRGMILANLAAVQMDNGLLPQAYDTLQAALAVLDAAKLEDYGYAIFTNLGGILIAQGRWEEAEAALQRALRWRKGLGVHALTEMSRLYMLTGRLPDSVRLGREVMDRMWSSVMAFDKEELAHVGALLGQMAYLAGDRGLALRLTERAQSLYGQLGLWHAWKNLGGVVLTIENGVPPNPAEEVVRGLEDVRRFADLVEIMLAQNLVSPTAWAVADLRNQVALKLAAGLGWDDAAKTRLGYVCRLADYGLTAVDRDVVERPQRSQASWDRYIQHPGLSVRLLSPLGLSPLVLDAVRDHHEQPDGAGFPEGKRSEHIAPAALVYGVADRYAAMVLGQGLSHSAALRTIRAQAGRALAESMVDCFDKILREAALDA
ncbi:MAG: hypothetical protein M0Z53_13515 [Thermaerobacter sp.]|nr:hypothetical protein [Thermaerobacter sp.]